MPTDLHIPIAKPASPLGEKRSGQFTMAKADPFRGEVQRGRIRGNRVMENIHERNGKTFSDLRVRLDTFCSIKVAGRAYAAGLVLFLLARSS